MEKRERRRHTHAGRVPGPVVDGAVWIWAGRIQWIALRMLALELALAHCRVVQLRPRLLLLSTEAEEEAAQQQRR